MLLLDFYSRSIPPDYNGEKFERDYVSDDSTIKGSKGGLQLDSQGNLRTKYPWDRSRRRKSVDSDGYSDSDLSRSSNSSRRKVEPINKKVIDEALKNFGTVGRVEAVEVIRKSSREIKERPDAEKPVKIPRPVASALVKEGSMRYPVPDYGQRKKIDIPNLRATRTHLRSIRDSSGELFEESCQVPDDTLQQEVIAITERLGQAEHPRSS